MPSLVTLPRTPSLSRLGLILTDYRATRGRRIPMLDGLRLVAALLVVCYHFLGQDGHPEVWGVSVDHYHPLLGKVAQYGYLGVEFFFLISGFVICMSCWGKSPKDFFLSRVTRLFPSFWFAVLATAAVVTLLPYPGQQKGVITPSQVITNLSMAPGALHTQEVDGVYWSLWVEARFYLLISVVMLLGMSYRRMLGFCGIWLMAALVTVQLQNSVLDEIVMPRYCGLFIAGIAIFLMRAHRPNLVLWGILGFSWVLELTMLHWRLQDPERDSHQAISWTISAGLVTVGLLLLLGVALGPLGRIQWSWLTTAGALTYPLYLLHNRLGRQVVGFVHSHFPHLNRALLFAVAVAALLGLAWLVHRYIERPLSRALKRGLTTGLHATP